MNRDEIKKEIERQLRRREQRDEFRDLPAETRFIYELSALGFNYRKDDHAWWNKRTGAVFADEAMRGIARDHPLLAQRILRLYAAGARLVEIKVEETDSGVLLSAFEVE